MRYKAILLDFYGTLVEEDDAVIDRMVRLIVAESPEKCTPADVVKAWRFTELCLRSFGTSFKTQRELELESLAGVLDRYRVPRDPCQLSSELFAYWRRPRACASSNAFLQEVAPCPVCIVSNIDTDDLTHALEHNNWPLRTIVTSEDVRAYKPRPEPFQAALARMGVRPDEAVHVGDSLSSDVAGAQSLGIDTIWVNRKNRPLPEGAPQPTYAVTCVGEALAILR